MIPVKDFAEVLSLHAALSLSVVLALLVLYYAISPATDDDNGKLWKNIRLLPDCPRLYQLLLLGPNILFFWWLICLKGCSLWWLSAIVVGLPLSAFLIRTATSFLAFVILAAKRMIGYCFGLYPERWF